MAPLDIEIYFNKRIQEDKYVNKQIKKTEKRKPQQLRTISCMEGDNL